MPKITVTSAELTKLSNSVKKRSEKIGKKIILESAQETAHKADWAFKRAKYDGANSVSVYAKTSNKNAVQIVAEGSAVKYIEYGTGAKANSSFVSSKSKQPYWFYTLPSGNAFKAGGTYAKHKVLKKDAKERRASEKADYMSDYYDDLDDFVASGVKNYKYKANGGMQFTYEQIKRAYDKGMFDWQKGFKGSQEQMDNRFNEFLYSKAIRTDGTKAMSKFKFKYTNDDYTEVPSKTSGITKGNEPHLIMTESVPNNFKKAIKKYK